ncbi:hypothetical protein MKX03_000972 [Papaver bracteatum]|nr:hypothetical protein MKX03_000972 [Papaver bracteatum]
MVATSLDLYDVVIKNYPDAKSNLESLRELGASITHGVDATKMKQFPDLRRRRFDRIIYNFPHAGFYGKENDVRMIKNASRMLRPSGKVHIRHKTTTPYDKWDLKYLATKHNLALVGCVKFRKEDYPGYKNKKGSGPRCNESFRLGECSTFKFEFLHCVKKYASGYIHTPPYQYQRTQLQGSHYKLNKLPCRPQNRIQFDVGYPHNLTLGILRTLRMFGKTGYHSGLVVHETLRTTLIVGMIYNETYRAIYRRMDNECRHTHKLISLVTTTHRKCSLVTT